MNRDEWIGLGTSVGAHLALVLLFALLTAGRPTPPTLGAVQLEIGTFAEGRPVQQAEAPSDEADTQPPEVQAPAVEASQGAPAEEENASSDEGSESEIAPAESAPVNLPEQESAPGEEPPPEEPPSESQEDAPRAQEPNEETEPAGRSSRPNEASEETASSTEATADSAAAGARDAQAKTAEATNEGGEEMGEASGAASGEEGTGDDAEQAAPFDIEGLDRTRLYGSMPQYTEKVNATIQVEITVNPEGEVIGQRLLRKANPSLERSVMEALRQWRFNRLPSGAPQKSQTGVVTFRFRLE